MPIGSSRLKMIEVVSLTLKTNNKLVYSKIIEENLIKILLVIRSDIPLTFKRIYLSNMNGTIYYITK